MSALHMCVSVYLWLSKMISFCIFFRRFGIFITLKFIFIFFLLFLNLFLSCYCGLFFLSFLNCQNCEKILTKQESLCVFVCVCLRSMDEQINKFSKALDAKWIFFFFLQFPLVECGCVYVYLFTYSASFS